MHSRLGEHSYLFLIQIFPQVFGKIYLAFTSVRICACWLRWKKPVWSCPIWFYRTETAIYTSLILPIFHLPPPKPLVWLYYFSFPPLSFLPSIVHSISHPVSFASMLPFLTTTPCGAVCHLANFYIKIYIILIVMFFRMFFTFAFFQSIGELERFSVAATKPSLLSVPRGQSALSPYTTAKFVLYLWE